MTEHTEAEHLWFKNAIIYGLDVQTFLDAGGDGMGDLRGVISKLDYLADLGITCLWLLPFYPSPYRDEGYDVRNYIDVSESAGNLQDFRNLVQLARERGIHVIIDIVVHHTSDTHPWFQASIADPQSRYRNYYIWTEQHPGHSPIKTMFPGVEDGVWQYDENARAFYHHIFYHFEPDLNFSNPDVRKEVNEIIEFWLAFGVSGFRIDAAKHLFEDKGLPGTAMDADPYLRDLHRFVRENNADAILLGEVNADHAQSKVYFGNGDRMQMLFNFPLNARLWLALARQQAEPLAEFLRTLPESPEETAWSPFLRNLDELALDRLSDADREEVCQVFAPEPHMRLYGRGIRRRLAPMLEGDTRRIKMAFSLLFSLPGAPMFVYGDEIGMGDDLTLDERVSVRTPMQWSNTKNAGFTQADAPFREAVSSSPFRYQVVNVEDEEKDPDSLLNTVKKFIALRKANPAIGCSPCHVLDAGSTAVLGLSYAWKGTTLMTVHNFSPDIATATIEGYDPGGYREIAADDTFGQKPAGADAEEEGRHITLRPYGYRWLRSGPE